MTIHANRFLHPPLPMVNGDKKYAIIWTPKVASNIILTWYLRDIGLLHAANFYTEWFHKFRADFLVKSKRYKEWMEDASQDHANYRYVKVMRDPFKRSVSSYRHALRFADTSGMVGRKMNIDVSKGFSYRTFLTFLSSLDIQDCDIHFRQQHHPLEDLVGRDKIDFVLLDTMQGDLVDTLTALLGDGSQVVDQGQDDAEKADEAKRVASSLAQITSLHHGKYGGDEFTQDTYIDRTFMLGENQNFPDFEKFRNEETMDLVRRIYAADYGDMEHVLGADGQRGA